MWHMQKHNFILYILLVNIVTKKTCMFYFLNVAADTDL